MGFWMPFLDSKLVPNTEFALQEKRATDALELTFAHNADPVAQDFGLIHMMSGQNHNFFLFVHLEHIPKVSPSTQVHS